MFDAKQYLEALEPAKFRAQNGQVYVGRILSTDQFFPLQEAMRKAKGKDGKTVLRQLPAVMKFVVDTFFPPPPWWRIGQKSAWYWIKQLPPIAQMDAVWDFMRSQGKLMGMDLSATPGTMQHGGSSDIEEDESLTDGSSHNSTTDIPASTISGEPGGQKPPTE